MDYPRIIVTKRGDGYHACLDGTDETVWGRGQSVNSAVGDLVITHHERFLLTVELPELPEPSPPNSSGTILAPQTWLGRAQKKWEELEEKEDG